MVCVPRHGRVGSGGQGRGVQGRKNSGGHAALAKRVAEAGKLYDSSKGKVADGKTRYALQQQLDAAGKLRDATDVKELKDAKAALDKAMDAVNRSVHAKQEEDRKDAQEQAQREAETQTTVPQPAMPSPAVPVQPAAPSYPAPVQPVPQPSVQEPAPS